MKNYLAVCCFSFIAVVSSACAQYDKPGERDSASTVIERERLKLKNAAFCACLYKSFPDSVFVNEGTAAAYLELGGHDIDTYTRIFDFAGDYVRSAEGRYKSKYNRSLAIMKCLDLYNSRELDELVRSADDEIDTETGNSNEDELPENKQAIINLWAHMSDLHEPDLRPVTATGGLPHHARAHIHRLPDGVTFPSHDIAIQV